MQITIKSRNLEIPDSLRTYITQKVERLDRFLPNIDEARVDLVVQNAKSNQDRNVAQLTLRGSNGVVLRAEERSADMRASIDTALDRMSRQIERYKGKHWQSFDRLAPEVGVPAEAEEADAVVVRTKTFQTRPMSVEEAVEQMELLGHDFFVFYNATSNGFSVVYRRRDGNYGLLVPELA
jgi:putative sigma-54 modulation protein